MTTAMLGSRRHKSASLRLTVPACLPVDMQAGVREITSLFARDRQQGHASALMRSVCNEATHKGIVLMLAVESYSGAPVDDERLEAFYAGFGFVKLQEEPVLMSRAPYPMGVH